MKTELLSMSTSGLENIEIERLQSFLVQQGHNVNHIHLNGNNDDDKNTTYLDLNCKLYIMSIYSESSVYPESLLFFSSLARRVKAEITDSIIFFIGKFASIYYKEILRDERFNYIDYIVLGDCEYTIATLIENIEKSTDLSEFVLHNNNIASRTSMDNKEFASIDINELPLPNRDFITKNKPFTENYYAFINDSHGCSMKCAFCTRGQFYQRWTGRSAESIFNEIKEIRENSKIKCFWFTGGSFEDPGGEKGQKKIRDFCELVLRNNLNVSMRCYLRSNFISMVDDDLFLLMKKAGFHVALVGIESGNEQDLKLYNKGTTVEKNKVALKRLKRAGIYADHFGFIMINPYSTMERLKANFLFLEEHQPHDLDNYVHHLVADPGTEIRKKIEKDRLLIHTDDFLKQGTSYRFLNKDVEEVSRFLRKHFLIFDTETAGISTFIFHFAPFISNGQIYEEETTILMQKRAKSFSDYFRALYLDFDIGFCERTYSDFMDMFKNYNLELEVIKNKLIKELIKYRIM